LTKTTFYSLLSTAMEKTTFHKGCSMDLRMYENLGKFTMGTQ